MASLHGMNTGHSSKEHAIAFISHECSYRTFGIICVSNAERETVGERRENRDTRIFEIWFMPDHIFCLYLFPTTFAAFTFFFLASASSGNDQLSFSDPGELSAE